MSTPPIESQVKAIRDLLEKENPDSAKQIKAIVHMIFMARSSYNNDKFQTFMTERVKPLIDFLEGKSGINWKDIERTVVEPLKNNELTDSTAWEKYLSIFDDYDFASAISKIPDVPGKDFKDHVVKWTKKMVTNSARKCFNNERYNEKSRKLFEDIIALLDKDATKFNMVVIALVFIGVNASKLPTAEAEKFLMSM